MKEQDKKTNKEESSLSSNDTPLPKKRKRIARAKLPDRKIREVQKTSDNNIANSALNFAFDRYKSAANEEFMEVNCNVEALQGVVSEFLEDFMVVGHTILGQRIVIRFAKTSKDYDALTDLMKRTVVKMFIDEQGPNNGGIF